MAGSIFILYIIGLFDVKKKTTYFILFVDIHLVSIQGTTLFGFICATINIAMVPSDANIVDITLVLLQVTTIFGFKCATVNAAMVPNYANIVNIHLV